MTFRGARRLLLCAAALLTLGATAGTAYAASPEPDSAPVIVIGVPGLSWNDMKASPDLAALIKNNHRKFICKDQPLRIENNRTAWTSDYDANHEITIVLKNQDGGYVADEATLDRLEGEGLVVARYLEDNPNGSYRDIAGISNERGNVVGLMPHPEHCVETLTGPSTDGLGFFTSVLKAVVSS